ncbi:hypothetical protein ACO0QE_001193 [Hanseniaspora vineae]
MSDSNDTGFFPYQPDVVLACVAFFLFVLSAISILVLVLLKYFKTIHRFELTSTYGFNREQIKKNLGPICVNNYLPLFVGALLELGGYLSRIFSAHNTFASAPYVVGTVLTVIAPTLISISMFLLFERMLKCLNVLNINRVAFFVRNSEMTKILIVVDVIIFFLQAAGSEILANEKVNATGRIISYSALFVQMVMLMAFLFVQTNFSFRYKKYSQDEFYLKIDSKWKYLNYYLICATLLLLVRTVQKFVEFTQARYKWYAKHEYFVYIFDALPMFLVISLLCVSFFFVDVGELFYNHYTITYEEKREDEYHALQGTASRDACVQTLEIVDWKPESS